MRSGARGDAVRDIQRRLLLAGHLTPGMVSPGLFCGATERAVAEFQRTRGLRSTGVCDPHTWQALMESSWSLGDRVLFHTAPMMRGDDVAEVQTVLGRLGFDAGRVDGIYGPDTAAAVAEFQHNCGLVVDGCCAGETAVALQRLSRHSGRGPGITTVREWETLSDERTVIHHRLVIGHFGGLGPLVRALARDLRNRGADIIILDDPEPLTQAAAANRFEAEAYLGLEASAASGGEVAYYGVPTFTSHGGLTLAHHIARRLRSGPFAPPHHISEIGLRLPILRETRMTAVMITLGPVRHVVDTAPVIAQLLGDALDAWLRLSPTDS